jgi:hypothetical protein
MDTAGQYNLTAANEMVPGIEKFGVPSTDSTQDQTSMQEEFSNYDSNAVMGMDITDDDKADDIHDQKLILAAWYTTHRHTTPDALCKAERVEPQILNMDVNPMPWYNRYSYHNKLGEGQTGYPGQFTSQDNRQANMSM